MKVITPTFGTGHVSFDEDGAPFLCTKLTAKNFLLVSAQLAERQNVIWSKVALEEIHARIGENGEAWVA